MKHVFIKSLECPICKSRIETGFAIDGIPENLTPQQMAKGMRIQETKKAVAPKPVQKKAEDIDQGSYNIGQKHHRMKSRRFIIK
jgi:hypothetical protein